MSRPNPAIFLAILLLFLALLGGIGLAKGALLIAKHEGDMLHFTDIVLRMADGQRIHRDFMTPIGALAFAPVVAFVNMGLGIGLAFLAAQALIAACLVPAVWWVGITRLLPGVAALLGLVVIVLATGLVHGESNPGLSLSMHYNRWAWALAFVAVITAVLPPTHPKNGVVDGLIIGTAMTALVMIKVTYFAALAPAVLVALVLTRQRRALVSALLTGLGLLLVLTLWLGYGFWIDYLDDLLTVAGSRLRPQPGVSLAAVLVAPKYLAGTLVALAAVVLLRQARADTAGVVLLLLLPGFAYVTYQNFGNDPQWLLLLAILVLSVRPASELRNPMGWPLRGALNMVAVMALALAAPSFFNLALSPFRHLTLDIADYAPLMPRSAVHDDLMTTAERAYRVDAQVAMDGPGGGLERMVDLAAREPQLTVMGEVLPHCAMESGMASVFDTIAQDLEKAGFAGGSRVFSADAFSVHWLFGNFAPLTGGAPWYYGGLPGFETADYLLVPLCPMSRKAQAEVFRALEERGTSDLTEVRRTPLYILYARG